MASIVSIVIHPSRIFREGLTSVLANSPFAPACVAASTKDVPSTISSVGDQLLVLVGFTEASNLAEVLRATNASFPDAHVVVIGNSTKRENVTTALELGATSFVDENVATSSLAKELELVTLGEPIFCVLIPKQLVGYSSARPYEKAVPMPAVDEPRPPETQDEAGAGRQLSRREAAILNGLVQGASNKVIAYQLKITEATVKVHVKAILRKIRVRNRTQAAIWALHHQALPMKLGRERNHQALPKMLGRERRITAQSSELGLHSSDSSID